jgi:C-terminal peptidase prc
MVEVAQVKSMRFQQKLIILFLCTFLIVSGCSKKKSNSSDTTPDPSITITKPDPNTTKMTFAAGTSTCDAVYKFLDELHSNYIVKLENNVVPMLQKASEKFGNNLLKDQFKISIEDVDFSSIKRNDCSVFDTLAAKVKDNEELIKAVGRTKDQFDPLEYILNGVLYYYSRSYDAVSSFRGSYVGNFSGADSAVRWGLKFLGRPEYYKAYKKDLDEPIKERNPQYLYIEYSPEYLKNKLPKFSRIYKIGDKQVNSLSYEDALIFLSKESNVDLEIQKWDEASHQYGKMEQVSVDFEEIYEPHETSFKIFSTNPNIVYLQIPSFSNKQLEEDYLETWVEYMHNISGKTAGVIIDLRNNGGGRNYQMQKILGTIFPDPKTVVNYRRSNQDGTYKLHVDTVQPAVNIDYGKIVVLTNYDSASASEMFVAAIKDYNGGLVVGETTYGKGIGQYDHEIDAERIKGISSISNFYLFSPLGNSWYFKGIEPHIEATEKLHKNYIARFTEWSEYLPKALSDNIDTTADIGSFEVKNKLTPEVLQKLKAIRNDPAQLPETCKKEVTDPIVEEESCILSWGYLLLQKWIELDPTAS